MVLWLCQQLRLSLPQALGLLLRESALWLKAARELLDAQVRATAASAAPSRLPR